jgi:predicted amidohydrolase YtcJ
MSTSADLVLYNATVYTVDAHRAKASAFAVQDGQFVAVGDDALRDDFPHARKLNARGATVVPGLIDAHAHLQPLGFSLRRPTLSGATSVEDVVQRLRSFVGEHNLPDGAWLRGQGWNETDWPTPPTRTALDAAFPERPIWLTRADIHAGWANTAALEETIGLSRLRAMSDPAGGTIRRATDGTPTGVLVDEAMAVVEDQMPAPSPEQHDRALETALHHAARHGVTSVHDAGIERDTFRRFRRFVDDGACPLRIYAMILGQGPLFDRICEHGPYHGPQGRLHVESVKFFADGALGSRGAALLAPYADDPPNRGFLLQEPDQFRHNVQTAAAGGLQVNTHAIGDRANRMVLDAYESVQQTTAPVLRRPRIEHAQVLHPDDLPRVAALDVIASVQPQFATSDMGWVGDRLGPARLNGAYAWQRLHTSGAPLAFGSDAPVEPMDPLRGFHAAVTRQDADGHPPGGWRPEERVSRATALHAYTQGAAYAAFQDDALGAIRPGTRADWTVLSQDIMQVPTAALLNTDVVATYVDGTPTYSGPDWPDA